MARVALSECPQGVVVICDADYVHRERGWSAIVLALAMRLTNLLLQNGEIDRWAKKGRMVGSTLSD